MNKERDDRGVMFGIPLDALLGWANVVYLCAIGIAAAGAISIYQLSARMNAAKDRELQQFQIEARIQIETAKRDAATANAHATEILKANTDLQLELEREKDARTAMLEQLQPRDMTQEQTAAFVETIKGKVSHVNLFTVPDPEATTYGITILDALRRANVVVNWYRTQSVAITTEGVSSTGVTVYENPAGGADGAGRTLMKAFTDMDAESHLLTQPLQGIPSPALFVARKPLKFLRAPDRLIPPETETHQLPWGVE
jgi:hypothetical protein